jgi:LEA14-like dessication related protein
MHRFKMSKRCPPRWLLVIAIILVVCAVVFAVIGARSCKEWLANKVTDVHITGISLKGISLTTVTVDVTFSVHNSSPMDAVLHRVAYDIYFEEDGKWLQLGSADRSEDTTIKGNAYTSLDITNELGTLPAIGAVYQAYRQGGTINIKVTGSAWVGIGPVSTEVPFERIEKIGF